MSDVKAWQMRVGPGWAKLVEQIVRVADNYDVKIVDIYEREGELRVDSDRSITTRAKNLFDAIKLKSSKMCEECGSPGSIVTIGHRKVARCEFHATEELYEQ